MKSLTLTAILMFAGTVAGYSQVPHRSLPSIFRSKLAFSMPSPDSTPVSTGVFNATGEATTISQNTWIEIKGSNLSPVTQDWSNEDFSKGLPTSMQGIKATVNGKPAFIYYISPVQVNVLTPIDSSNPTGPVAVTLTNSFGTTAPINVNMVQNSLGIFTFNFTAPFYPAAIHATNTCPTPYNGACLLGPPSLYAGLSTPAQPGETIVLFANGFGQTTPPLVNGTVVQQGALPTKPVITIGGLPAQVIFAGAVAPGEYQFNVVVPSACPDGDNALVATYNGATTQPNVFVNVKR